MKQKKERLKKNWKDYNGLCDEFWNNVQLNSFQSLVNLVCLSSFISITPERQIWF